MDKLTSIKIKYNDDSYSDEIPIIVFANNVNWDSGHTLTDVLGNIDMNTNSLSIQAQLNKLFNEKANVTDVMNYVANNLRSEVDTWLSNNIDSSELVGEQGADGKSAYEIASDEGFQGNELEWLASLKGKSAYDIAVEQGFDGANEAEWINSLHGKDGVIYFPAFEIDNNGDLKVNFETDIEILDFQLNGNDLEVILRD